MIATFQSHEHLSVSNFSNDPSVDVPNIEFVVNQVEPHRVLRVPMQIMARIEQDRDRLTEVAVEDAYGDYVRRALFAGDFDAILANGSHGSQSLYLKVGLPLTTSIMATLDQWPTLDEEGSDRHLREMYEEAFETFVCEACLKVLRTDGEDDDILINNEREISHDEECKAQFAGYALLQGMGVGEGGSIYFADAEIKTLAHHFRRDWLAFCAAAAPAPQL